MLDKSAKASRPRPSVVIKKYANRRLYNTESSTYVTLEDLAQMVRDDRDFVVYDAKSGDDLTHSVLTQIIVEQEGRAGGPTLLPIPFLRQLIRFYDDSMGTMVPGYLQFSLEALTQQQDAYREKFAHAWGAGGLDAYREQARNNLKIFEQAMAMWTPFNVTDMANHASDDQADASGQDKTGEDKTGSDKTGGSAQAAGSGPARTTGNGAANGVASGGGNAGNHGASSSHKVEAATGEHGHATAPRDAKNVSQSSEIDALKSELEAMQRRIERLSQTR